MQEKAETFELDYYIKLIIKHRWLIIIPFCISMIVGIYLSVKLPRIYQAITVILVEPQKVPSNFVRAIISDDIESRIVSMEQQILSRTNVEKIIDKFSLLSGPGSENVFTENKVASIKSRTTIKVSRAPRRGGANSFSISFKDADPVMAMKIANGLATLFIDENLKIREDQALGTSDFLEDELDSMRKRLATVEEKLRGYRERYRGELPEQLESNLRILENLQEQLNEREQRLSDEKDRLIAIEDQIQTRKELLTTSITVQSDTDDILTLEQMKNRLADLETNYTDIHPDIISLRSKIAALEAKNKNDGVDSSNHQQTGSSGTQSRFLADRILSEQINRRMEIKIAIKDNSNDIVKLKSQMNIYQQRVEHTPKREEELLALNRDYNNLQLSYNSLLNRKLEAEIAVNMEKKQKGEQFRVLDPARIPHKPISPDLRRLLLIVVAAGLGLGSGLIFLLDFFDTSLKNSNEFETDLGVSLLATIPKVYQKKDFLLKQVNRILTGVFLLVAVCLFAGFAALAFYGVEPTIEIVRPYMAFLKL